MTTRARVVVQPPGHVPLRVEEVNLPDPGPHQVVVRQFCSGVCHSQLHQMHRDREQPIVLGHESTGVVLARGKEVTHVTEGDHVMVTWVARTADATRLPEAASLALPDGSTARAQGVFTWADHTLADELYVVKMPPDARTDVTAIIPCAVMTGAGAVLHTAGVKEGHSVAVFGVGGVGLAAVAAASVVGADPIVAVDLHDAKLDLARKFGATHAINASNDDPVARIRELTSVSVGARQLSGVDFAFDCIGHAATTRQILSAARGRAPGTTRGGTAVLVGIPTAPLELNGMEIIGGGKNFTGSLGGSCVPDKDFAIFLDWFASGKLDLDALVTDRYKLDDINDATQALEAGRIAGRAILELD